MSFRNMSVDIGLIMYVEGVSRLVVWTLDRITPMRFLLVCRMASQPYSLLAYSYLAFLFVLMKLCAY